MSSFTTGVVDSKSARPNMICFWVTNLRFALKNIIQGAKERMDFSSPYIGLKSTVFPYPLCAGLCWVLVKPSNHCSLS